MICRWPSGPVPQSSLVFVTGIYWLRARDRERRPGDLARRVLSSLSVVAYTELDEPLPPEIRFSKPPGDGVSVGAFTSPTD